MHYIYLFLCQIIYVVVNAKVLIYVAIRSSNSQLEVTIWL